MTEYFKCYQDKVDFADGLRHVLNEFEGYPIDRFLLTNIKCAIYDYRRQFLCHRRHMVEDGDITVTSEGNVLNVIAKVISVPEKIDQDSRQAELQRFLDKTEEERIRNDAIQKRRYDNMVRRLGKLEKSHSHSLPPSTRAIWSTLDEFQRYAILKDLDYSVRHGESK